MKPYSMFSLGLALAILLPATGCSSHRSERRYDTPNIAAPHDSAARTPYDRRAKLVDPVDQAMALNGLPASEVAKRTASTLATRHNLAANQGLRNDVYNFNNTLDAPANVPQPFVVFQKDNEGRMHALMVDPRTSTVVNDALVEDNGGKARLAYSGSDGKPATMDLGLLTHQVQEGQIICQGTQQAVDLQLYAERANFEVDSMDDQRTQMALNRFNSGLSMIAGSADVGAFASDRLASSINSWRQIVGTDPRAVTGGFLPFQGGATSWGSFFTPNSSTGFIGR